MVTSSKVGPAETMKREEGGGEGCGLAIEEALTISVEEKVVRCTVRSRRRLHFCITAIDSTSSLRNTGIIQSFHPLSRYSNQ